MPTLLSLARTLPALIVLLAAPCLAAAEDPPKKEEPAAASASSEAKEAGRELARDAKSAGREIRESKAGRYVEEAARELGRDISGVSKQGLDKSKSLSASAAEEVKRATREFWSDVIRTKEAVAAKLRKENAELRSRKSGEPRASEPAKEAP